MAAIASYAALALFISAVPCRAAPLQGPQLAQRSDNAEVINEPCYVHDAACAGYPVCCVTAGTCVSQHSGTISSTLAYYEGGCQSLSSRKTDWSQSPGCTQQGECLPQHLEVCKGGTTNAGFMTELPAATLARFMTGSCGTACPNSNYGHGSYGGGGSQSNDTTTETTTTTMITDVTKTITLMVSDVAAAQSSSNMELMVTTALADMCGVSQSLVTVNMPTLAESMQVTYHCHVSNVHSMTASEVAARVDAMSDTQVDEMLAMRIGTCGYTVTAVTAESSSKGLFPKAGSVMLPLVALLVGTLLA